MSHYANDQLLIRSTYIISLVQIIMGILSSRGIETLIIKDNRQSSTMALWDVTGVEVRSIGGI